MYLIGQRLTSCFLVPANGVARLTGNLYPIHSDREQQAVSASLYRAERSARFTEHASLLKCGPVKARDTAAPAARARREFSMLRRITLLDCPHF